MFGEGNTYRVEVRDERTGQVVWSRQGVTGGALMKLAPLIQQATEAARDVGGAVGALGRAFGSLKRLGGGQ